MELDEIKIKNQLIENSFRSGVLEQKVLMFFAEQVQLNELVEHKHSTPEIARFRIPLTKIKDYVQNGDYRDIKKAILNIQNFQMSEKVIFDGEDDEWTAYFHIFERAYFNKKQDAFMFSVIRSNMHYFENVDTRYTRLLKQQIRVLHSNYSLKMLQICEKISNQTYTNKTYTLTDFRHLLDVPKSYTLGDFKKRILNIAQKELNDKTRVSFEYTLFRQEARELRRGQPSFDSIKITVSKK